MTDPSTSNGVQPKQSHGIHSLKDHAAQQIKEVQSNYAVKEEIMKNMFRHGVAQGDKHFGKEYEQILQANISKLEEITKEDFKSCNHNNQKLIEDTKLKIHEFIYKAFQNHGSKKDFAQTAEDIFKNINKKVKYDLKVKTASIERTRSSMSPDINLNKAFVIKKFPEEVEAEQLLQKFFEEELLQFNDQIKEDFKNIRLQIVNDVDKTKDKVTQAMLHVTPKELPKGIKTATFTDTEAFSNLPSKSTIETNLNSLLSHAETDFNKASEHIQADVKKTQEGINENIIYYYEKGKQILHFQSDGDEDNDDP